MRSPNVSAAELSLYVQNYDTRASFFLSEDQDIRFTKLGFKLTHPLWNRCQALIVGGATHIFLHHLNIFRHAWMRVNETLSRHDIETLPRWFALYKRNPTFTHSGPEQRANNMALDVFCRSEHTVWNNWVARHLRLIDIYVMSLKCNHLAKPVSHGLLFRTVQLLSSVQGALAVLVPRSLWTVTVIWKFKLLISWFRDFTRRQV